MPGSVTEDNSTGQVTMRGFIYGYGYMDMDMDMEHELLVVEWFLNIFSQEGRFFFS